MGAAPEPVPELDETLVEQWHEIQAQVTEQRQRADRLRALAEHAEDQAEAGERILAELEGHFGVSPQMLIEDLDRELRGRRLQEMAVTVLSREVEPGETIHYREWYRRLVDRGHRVGGRDPLANFLSHISRAPEVEALGKRSGLYRLRNS